jgi:DNA invertase Pin-like site-specific DNA recombinase
MFIGYARVSTTDQTLALQRDALKRAGCERIFTDTASGSIADRHGLEDAISQLRPGDALVVWRLDRLGRSLRHLIETVTALDARGVGFKSLTEQIDTTTSGGKLVFHIFGALAEFERDIIRERTQAGLQAARARGRQGGRPKLSSTARKVALARKLYEDRQTPVPDICRDLNISRATLYRYLRRK